MEPVAHHTPSQLWGGRHVDARLVRDVIGVGQEVLATDLTLPPRAPVIKTGIQRVEGLVLRCIRVIPLEECVAVGKFGFPWYFAELICTEYIPCGWVHAIVVFLVCIFQF